MRTFASVTLLALLAVGCRSQAAAKAPASETASPGAGTAAPAPAGTPQPQAAGAQPVTPPVKPVPAELPAILATVDDDKVERWELEGAIKSMEARAGGPIPTDRRDEIVRGLLDQVVAYHVLSLEAKERKIGVSDAEVSARLAQIKGGFPNEEAFTQALAGQGITLDQLQRQTRMGMDIEKVLDTAVSSEIKVEDSEIGSFYEQNRQQFEQAESVHASHILIAVPQGADAKQKDIARGRAQDVLKLVKAGGDFASLAKEHSQDPGSAPGGGDLGFFPKGQTVPAFETAAFGLNDGAVSDVVETQFGFHVIKVHEHRAARTAPLDEVSPQIRQFLSNQKRDAGIQTFIEQVKAKRKVQILV